MPEYYRLHCHLPMSGQWSLESSSGFLIIRM